MIPERTSKLDDRATLNNEECLLIIIYQKNITC